MYLLFILSSLNLNAENKPVSVFGAFLQRGISLVADTLTAGLSRINVAANGYSWLSKNKRILKALSSGYLRNEHDMVFYYISDRTSRRKVAVAKCRAHMFVGTQEVPLRLELDQGDDILF